MSATINYTEAFKELQQITGEIETGEIVGAGHASTTGRFDDEQLFSLESRGIPANIARQLVIRGFFLEIVSKLGLPQIEERIMTRIEAELEKASS